MQTPTYFPLGLIAAHTAAEGKGFRQREVKFFLELFSNWVTLGSIGAVAAVHNTQISRYVQNLCEEGDAKKSIRNKTPHYLLTRGGLFRLLQHLTRQSYVAEHAHGLLVATVLSGYKELFAQYLLRENSPLSKFDKLELEELLSVKNFVTQQLEYVQKERARLKARIDSSNDMHKLVTKTLQQGTPLESCIPLIAKESPYELNSTKRFDKLMASLPKEIAAWELTKGIKLRAETLFASQLEGIESYQKNLMLYKQYNQ